MHHPDPGQQIHITIDGHLVATTSGEHTGRQLRQLTTPHAEDLYLDVPDAPDAAVLPETVLLVSADMRFFTRPLVQIFLNGTGFRVPAGTITEQQLRHLPAPPIPEDDRLWLDVVDAPDDPLAPDELIVIQDGSRFFSRPLTFKVVVNGRPRTVDERQLTFEEIIAIAFPNEASTPDTIHTVTYSHAVAPKPAGSLHAGETLTIKKGTILSVTSTTKS
jgi:hypothetical protein